MLIRRAAAFALDLLFLNLIGRGIYWSLRDRLFPARHWVFALGTAVFAAYFVFSEALSALNASPGKLIAGLKVASPFRKPHMVFLSIVRVVILLGPFVMINYLDVEKYLPPIASPFWGGILLVMFAMQFSYPLLHRGACVQDIISRVTVMRKGGPEIQPGRFSRRDLLLVIILALGCIADNLWFSRSGGVNVGCQESYIAEIRASLPEDPAVVESGVWCLNLPWEGSKAHPTVSIDLQSARPSDVRADSLMNTVTHLAQRGVKIPHGVELLIGYRYTLDLGIYKYEVMQAKSFDTLTWKAN